jgi:hypothetical protein
MTTAGIGTPGTYPVTATARALVRASTLVLPAGAIRDRYRLEHHGELSALAANHQIRYAMGALSTAWALRQATTQEKEMTTTPARKPKPLLCRLNIHHRWRVEHVPGGEAYRRCKKCGKDDPGSFIEGTPDIIGGHGL